MGTVLALGVRRPHRTSAAFAVALAAVVLISIAAGALHQYDSAGLFVGSLVFALAGGGGFAVVRRSRAPRPDEDAPPPESTSEPSAEPEPSTEPEPDATPRGVRHVLNAAFALLLLVNVSVYAWRAVLAVRLPPLGYDALYYHLVSIAEWINHRALVSPFLGLGSGAHDPTFLTQADTFPKNAELTGGWVATFLHSVAAASLVQLVFVVWLGFAVAGCCTALGVRRELARVAALLVTLCPAVITQSDQFYVDIARVAPVAASFEFLLLAFPAGLTTVRAARRPNLVLAGTALGFGLGVKSSNLVTVAVVLVVAGGFVVGIIRNAEAAGTPVRAGFTRLFLPIAPWVLVPTLAVGSYWYVRTWAHWGSPFWPYTVGPFHGRAADDFGYLLAADYHTNSTVGAIAKSWWAATSILDGPLRGDADLGSLGLFWLFVGLPAVVALVLFSRWNRRAAFAVALPLIVLTLAAPAAFNTRYDVPISVAGAVALVALLDAGIAGTWRKPRAGRATAVPGAVPVCVLLLVAAMTAALLDTWAATRFANFVNGQTLSQEVDAVTAAPAVRAVEGVNGTYSPTMATLPVGIRIGFFSDDPPLLTYGLLGPHQRNELVVLGVDSSAHGVLEARQQGIRYVYLHEGNPLIPQLPGLGAVIVGPVYLGMIVDLAPSPRLLEATLPTAAEATALLGGPVEPKPTTATAVIAQLTGAPHPPVSCATNGVQQTATQWTSGSYRLAATACLFSDDRTPDSIALSVLTRLMKSGYTQRYSSPDRLTRVYARVIRGHLHAVAVIRLLGRLELVDATAPTSAATLIGPQAEAMTGRLGAI